MVGIITTCCVVAAAVIAEKATVPTLHDAIVGTNGVADIVVCVGVSTSVMPGPACRVLVTGAGGSGASTWIPLITALFVSAVNVMTSGPVVTTFGSTRS